MMMTMMMMMIVVTDTASSSDTAEVGSALAQDGYGYEGKMLQFGGNHSKV